MKPLQRLIRFPLIPILIVLVTCSGAGAQLSSVAWKAVEQLEKEGSNEVSFDDDGYVKALRLGSLPDGFLMGQLEVFPRLETVIIDSRYYFEDSTMGGIGKLKRLKRFVLRNSRYATSVTLEMLAEAPALEFLELDDCSDIDNLHEISRLRRLEHLAIIPDEALSFKPLAQCKHLKSIRLANSDSIDDESVREIAGVKTLEKVDLSNTAISDEGLAELGKLPRLGVLVLKQCGNVTGEGFSDFQYPLALRDINLEQANSITDQGLAALGRFSQIEHLRLYRNGQIRGSGFECLASMQQLKTLECPNTTIADEHLKLLDGISTLETVWLPGCRNVSGRGIDWLSNSQSCRKLSLNDCRKIDSPDFQVLAKFRNLEELYIANTRIRDEEIDRLCQLNTLRVLNISGNHWLSDEAFKKLEGCSVSQLIATDLPRLTGRAFESASRMKNLRDLSISAHREIDGTGLKFFPGNTQIRCLTFEVPAFLSLDGLACIRQIPNLEELSFREGAISIAQLEQLAGMKKLRKLKYNVEDAENASERLISILGTFPNLE